MEISTGREALMWLLSRESEEREGSRQSKVGKGPSSPKLERTTESTL